MALLVDDKILLDAGYKQFKHPMYSGEVYGRFYIWGNCNINCSGGSGRANTASTAQHSTAQHSTAQHSTAPVSTARTAANAAVVRATAVLAGRAQAC